MSRRDAPSGRTVTRAAAVRRLRRLFWDHPLRAGDLDQHRVWVLERVLEYGTLEDLRTLLGLLGREAFLDGVAQARFQSEKTRRFWQQMLALESRRCTKKPFPRTVWP